MEITKAERNHKLLLTARNLGANPFPYIIPVVPCSLPVELIEGEHFVLADLFKLNPGSSSQAVSTQEDQAGAATGTLVRSARATQPQSSRPVLRPTKKKKENRTRAWQTKATGAGLEDFVDWTGIIASDPAEEGEMSSLVVGFAAQMLKRVAGSEGETVPRSDGKRSKWSSLDEEAQKD